MSRRLVRKLSVIAAATLRHRVALGLFAVSALAAPLVLAPTPASAQDWGATGGDQTAAKIDRYKVLVNSSAEEGYAFKQLMKTVGKGREYDKLVEEYQAKVEADPDNYKWRMLLGHMLRYGNNLEQALVQYEAAAAVKETALAYESMAMVHDANKSMEEAIANYEKALDKASDKDQKERILRALASMALSRRKLDEAKTYFARLVELKPKDLFLRKELAQLLIEHKLYDEALEQLEVAQKLAGRNVVTRTQIQLDVGGVLEKQGKSDEAIEVYRDAAKKASSDSWLQTEIEERIIGIYRSNNELHKLVEYYEDKWKSPTFDQHMILSRLYEELGDDKGALEQARKAIKKRSNDADARQRLVRLLERTGDIEAVIDAYQDMIKALPGEARFRFELADLLYRSQRRDDAIAVLEKTGKSFSRDAGVHSKLAEKYLNWDLRDKALTEYKLLVKLEPSEPTHLENLGEFYFQTGEKDEALATWKKVTKVVADKTEAHLYLGRIYADHNMVDDAIAEYKIALDLSPDNLSVNRALGEVYERGRRFNDAIGVWEDILGKSQDKLMRREARQHIINIYHQQQTLRANLYQYERKFEGNPPDVEAGYFLAEAHLKLKDLEAATAVLEKILEAQPEDIEALLALEKGYSDLGEFAKSITILETLAEVDANRARVYYQKIADNYLKLGDPDSAEEWMVATIEANANDSRSFAKLGDVYRKKREFEKAAEMYEEAINVDSRAYDHYFVLADIYAQLRRDDEADKLHRQIVQNAIDESMTLKAARRTIDYNQFKGTLDGLEDDIGVLMHKTPKRPAYNQILLEFYIAMAQDPIARSRSGSPEDRASAREELRSIGRRAIKPMLDTLAEQNIATQVVAIDLLGEIRNPNAALQLSILVDNPNDELSLRAALALGRIGSEGAVEALAKASASPYERRIRELATWGLGRTEAAGAVPVLVQRTTENLQTVRALAAIGLGRLGDDAASPSVRERLKEDAAQPVLAAAAWAAGRLGDEGARDLLTDLVREESGMVAAHAAWALGGLGNAGDADVLLDAYWGGSPRVREAAGFALVRLATDDAPAGDGYSLWEENAGFIDIASDTGFDVDGLLEEILVNETRSLNAGGEVAVEKFGTRIANAADRWLHADDGARITAVLRDLDGTSGSLGLAALRIESTDSPLASVVQELVPTLEGLLASTVAEQRWHAASLLGKVKATAAVPALTEMMKSDDDPEVRRKAALALGNIGDSSAYAPLFEALNDDYFGVRAHAAVALGMLGDPKAYDVLVGLLDDKYAFVAGGAATGLGLLGDARAVQELESRVPNAGASVQAKMVGALRLLGADVSAYQNSVHAIVRDAAVSE